MTHLLTQRMATHDALRVHTATCTSINTDNLRLRAPLVFALIASTGVQAKPLLLCSVPMLEVNTYGLDFH